MIGRQRKNGNGERIDSIENIDSKKKIDRCR